MIIYYKMSFFINQQQQP